MPIYEFQCPKCEHKFEKVTSHSKIKTVECPECNENPVERLMSVFSAGANKITPQFRASIPKSGCGHGGFS